MIDKGSLTVFSPSSPTVNYNDRLNDKKTTSGRSLEPNAGYTLHSNGRSYVVLGPKALDASDFGFTRVTLNHEFDHVRQDIRGSKLQGNESELDAWTTSFIRDFHRAYRLRRRTNDCYVDPTSMTWTQPLSYYSRQDVSESLRERTVDRIQRYYRDVIANHPAHKKVFRYWIHRSLVKEPSQSQLAVALNKALALGIDASAPLKTSFYFPCEGLESKEFRALSVDVPTR